MLIYDGRRTDGQRTDDDDDDGRTWTVGWLVRFILVGATTLHPQGTPRGHGGQGRHHHGGHRRWSARPVATIGVDGLSSRRQSHAPNSCGPIPYPWPSRIESLKSRQVGNHSPRSFHRAQPVSQMGSPVVSEDGGLVQFKPRVPKITQLESRRGTARVQSGAQQRSWSYDGLFCP